MLNLAIASGISITARYYGLDKRLQTSSGRSHRC